jgi:dihydrodipicolinate synthase/N-acetylneuraminate lyase
MQTTAVSSANLRSSVIAVPPLARNPDLVFEPTENARLIKHLESGGVTTLLYGGNANFYHIALSEYEKILASLIDSVAPDTLLVPSAGPAFGTMMDQAPILRNFDFPTTMVLPQSGLTTPQGVATGLRKFAEALGKPIVLYLKSEDYLPPESARSLVDDGLVSWIKYAIVRDNPAEDNFLDKLTSLVDPSIIVSGMGEQPAIVHLQQFHLTGFTAGCVCIRPDLSQEMLEAIQANDIGRAEEIRTGFQALEDLRDNINPIRVLHDAVTLAGIADMGPQLPLLSNLSSAEKETVAKTALDLLHS